MDNERVEVEQVESQSVVVRERSAVRLVPVMNVEDALAGMHEFQRFISEYLEESKDGGATGDYGVIAGTKKKTLLKSGADKLCEVYGLADKYVINGTIDWETGLFDYEITCLLFSRRDDSLVGTGVGCCSSFESKYRWRDSQRACPKCGNTTIQKGKEEYGGGWLCWAKKGGCGAKFKDGDKSIESQTVGRVENPDIADIKNTVLKMAKKRAKIDATIGATRSSGILTQDLDEIPPERPVVKPEVQKTTEDIHIERPAKTFDSVNKDNFAEAIRVPNPGKAGGEAKPIQRAEPPSVAVPSEVEIVMAKAALLQKPAPLTEAEIDAVYQEAQAAMAATPASLPPGAIESGQQINIHREFKDALKPALRKKADDLLHDWFKAQGIVDGDGNGTSKAILKDNFYEVREMACTHAKSL